MKRTMPIVSPWLSCIRCNSLVRTERIATMLARFMERIVVIHWCARSAPDGFDEEREMAELL